MIKRFWLRSVVILAAVAAILAPAAAQAQIKQVNPAEHRHSIGFNLGYFALTGNDSSKDDNVLWNDQDVLLFNVKDFNGFTYGGEYLLTLGKYLEAGVNVGYYQHSVPSIYRDLTFDNGKEIEQELKLRVIPVTATVRFLPIGHGPVEPYVGGGIGFFDWHYTESGEFVDYSDMSIFRQTYEAKGNEVGPVVLAGLRAPIATAWDVGVEVQWHSAKGHIDPQATGLLGSSIDLSGWTTSFTTHVRF